MKSKVYEAQSKAWGCLYRNCAALEDQDVGFRPSWGRCGCPEAGIFVHVRPALPMHQVCEENVKGGSCLVAC